MDIQPFTLPEEVLATVFYHLNIRDLAVIPAVCKVWEKVSEVDFIWNKYCVPEDPPSSMRAKMVIKCDLFSLLEKIKTMPNILPQYESEFFSKNQQDLGSEEAWEAYESSYLKKSHMPIKNDYSNIRSYLEARELLELVAYVFAAYIKYSRTGLTSLSQAEGLALRTQWTFMNPYPFKILSNEYEKKENCVKAEEMFRLTVNLNQCRHLS